MATPSASPLGRTIAFGHMGLSVQELDRSRAYYRDIIGLVEIEHGVRSDAYLQALTGYPGAELNIALFVEPRSQTLLELLEYRGVTRSSIDPATGNPGVGHMCFEVDDVEAVYRRALDAGHRAVSAPVTPTTGRWTDGRSVYLLDPDGVRVELVQRAAPGVVREGSAEIESVYLVEAQFVPDAETLRKPLRAQHLARIARLKSEGVLIESGAFTDSLTASLMIVRAPAAAHARRVAEDDIYYKEGIWRDIQVRPFGRVRTAS